MDVKKINIKQIATVGILAILAIICLFPIYFLVINSLKSQSEIVESPMAFPKSIGMDYILKAMEKIDLGSSLCNTVIITVCAVVLIVLVS